MVAGEDMATAMDMGEHGAMDGDGTSEGVVSYENYFDHHFTNAQLTRGCTVRTQYLFLAG
jgi:hypothetical protein